MKKIDLMYATFGVDPQCRKCKDCPCLVRVSTTGRAYYKCSVYGQSSSTATDWAGKWMACGRFGKPLEQGERTVLWVTKGDKGNSGEGQLPGQIRMEV